MKRILRRIIQDEKGFCEELKQKWSEQNNNRPQEYKKDLASVKKRLTELDALITGLYENYISGILPERQYKTLMTKYSEEQSELESKIADIQAIMQENKEPVFQADKFIKLIKKYKEPTELTTDMVDDLIDKIVVHEKTETGENRCQQVDIYFNFIGKFDLEYTDEEIAEQKQLAEQAAKEKHERKLERVRLYDKRKREIKRAERLVENDGHLFAKKICEHCGREYYPNSAKQKFCCKDCCTNATNDRRRKKRYAEKGNHLFKQKNCKLCGKPFWPVNGQEVLCSPECKAQNRRTKQLEYYHTHKKLKSRGETQ